jgi:hypothetical protein
MKLLNVVALVIGLSMIAGCANKSYVETDHQAGYDFATLKTFSVAETKQETKDSLLVSPFTLSHIHQVLGDELGKRYQKESVESKPDFIVNYYVVVEEKIDPRSYNDFYGYGGYGWYGHGYYPYPMYHGIHSGIRTYNQGSLIIDIVDSKTNKPIWRGVSQKRLSKGMAPQNQREVLSMAVSEVMAQFPPVN